MSGADTGTGGGWFVQVGRALTRLLNALAGGDGGISFSARSWQMKLRGEWIGRVRVAFVDSLPGMGEGHCKAAYDWAVAMGWIVETGAPRLSPAIRSERAAVARARIVEYSLRLYGRDLTAQWAQRARILSEIDGAVGPPD